MITLFKAVFAMSFFAMIVHFNQVSARERSERDVHKEFEGSGVQPNVAYVTYEGRMMRYVEVNNAPAEAPAFIFVHGAPGSWDAFKLSLIHI